VDTPVDSKLLITIPDDLSFDESKDNYCSASTNIVETPILCSRISDREVEISVEPAQVQEAKDNGITVAKSGTSYAITIGYIFNPVSLHETSSFRLETYTIDDQDPDKKYYVNREVSGVTIRNENRGPTEIESIKQTGSDELGAQTAIEIAIKTYNKIPSGSQV
jgi:hypothetical protein